MGRLLIPAAVFLLMATAASSQVTNVVSSRSVVVSDLYDELSVSGSVPDSAKQYSFPNGPSPFFQAIENYQVSADVTPTEITFANNVTSQGFYSSTSSSTVVSFTYTNMGTSTVNASLESTILPGGFGFYMDAPQNNPSLAGASIGDVNQTPQSTTATFTSVTGYTSPGPDGYAGFSFDILKNGAPVASYAANVALNLSNPASGVDFAVVSSAAPALRGFALVTPAGSNQAVGYQWDTTQVVVPLGALAPGQSATLTYETTVTSSTNVQNTIDCPVANLCPQLLAYAGFGDPIRKSSGTGTDPYFPTFDLALPTFDPSTGVVGGTTIEGVSPSLPLAGVAPATFTPIPSSILTAAPVPEPETWMLMLAAMGGAGAAVRGGRRSANARRKSGSASALRS